MLARISLARQATHKTARTGAVALIQRFGSALNLNIHFHMCTKAPTLEELNKLVHTLSHRVARYLERQGLLVRDMENTYLQLDTEDADAGFPFRGTYGAGEGRRRKLKLIPDTHTQYNTYAWLNCPVRSITRLFARVCQQKDFTNFTFSLQINYPMNKEVGSLLPMLNIVKYII